MSVFILTILFGYLGYYRFHKKQTVLGIAYLCTFGFFGIGYIFDIVTAYDEYKTFYSSKRQRKIDFAVAGVTYRIDNLESIGREDKAYYKDDDELIKTRKKPVYKYHFPNTFTVEFEPDNPNDRNAIKILVDNVHIGYVPKELCTTVKKYITNDAVESYQIRIGGGDFKEIENGYVIKRRSQYKVNATIHIK